MKILFVSNLFPDAADPVRGKINATLLKHLAEVDGTEVRAVGLRPKVAFVGRGKSLQPRAEDEFLQPVYAPVSYVPKIGSRFNHRLLAKHALPVLKRVKEEFPYDAILGSWIYPDVCGLARLLPQLKVPMVGISQGSDVHQYLGNKVRRKLIVDTLRKLPATITRSRDLRTRLIDAGVPDDRLHAVYNGVNNAVFHPGDRTEARRKLGLPESGRIVLYVGNFLRIKNPLLLVLVHAHRLLAKAMAPRPHLVMIGTGPLAKNAAEQTEEQGTAGITHLVGRKSSAEVADYMRAADVLCIPSDNEGVPNVAFEAMGCGLPVVATRVGGIPEVVCEDFLGALAGKGDQRGLAEAVTRVLSGPDQSAAIARHAAQFSWANTAAAYLRILGDAVAG